MRLFCVPRMYNAKTPHKPIGVGALDDPRAMCKRYAQTVGVGALDDLRAMCKRSHKPIGRRLPPAGKTK